IVKMFGAKLRSPEAPLALILRLRLKPGTRDRAAAAFALARVPTLRDPGVQAFELHWDTTYPDVVVVYERWRSLNDLAAHLHTTHAKSLRETWDDLSAGLPEFSVLTPAA